ASAATGGCIAAPRAWCVVSESASLSIKESPSGRERLDLSFKNMAPEVPLTRFGDPVAGTTRYDVCLYDAAAALVGTLTVDRAGQLCGPRAEPCWQPDGGNG